MRSSLFKSFINFILPPRRTEMIVDALTIEDLHSLQTQDGLPYHAEEVAALVWELKYYGNRHAAALAGELLAEELLALASEELGPPLLIPIPMHKARLRERGHNQTELLCKSALSYLAPQRPTGAPADFIGKTVWLAEQGPEDFFTGKSAGALEYSPQALIRTINTPHQQTLERSKRLHNVKNSMQAREPEKIKGRVCIVVDDVATTGATMSETVRALKAAGALRVHTVSLAQS